MRKFYIVLLILILSSFFRNYSYVYAVNPILEKAISLYKEEKHDSVIILIRNYLRQHGKEEQTELLVPLIIESLVRRNELASAHRLFSMFRVRFPNSPFLPRLWYIEGVALGKEEKYPNAIAAFSTALSLGVPKTLDSLVIVNCEKIGSNMTIDEFSELKGLNINSRIIEVLKYYEIEKLILLGQFTKAKSYAEEFKSQYPKSKYLSILKEEINKALDAQKKTIQIGVLAPISGEDEEIGKRIVQGIQLAISQYQPQIPQTIKTIILDTKGNMITTAQKTRELCEVHKVPIIIGPVLSHTAIVTAAMLMNKPVVMVSPTATEEGISEIGENIFQINVTTGALGRRIAKYAIENLSIKDFAILAPNTPYGHILASTFKEEVKRSNLEIIAEEYFEEGQNDYREQFQNIRKKLLIRYLERLAIEKGTTFSGEITKKDSALYADSSLSVGGLFMPAAAEDVIMLAPQVVFYRIKTQMLGCNGWHNPKVLKEGKKYVVNALFSTYFETDATDNSWVDFAKVYKYRYNIEADRVSALGYDAATLILKAIKESNSDDPNIISKQLGKTYRYKGLSGVISFENGQRANSESAVYKITENGFVRVH
ncbi:MAG: ABC transporter substrate-binding protein [Chitinispirillaceae bacterium]|nr:ABC transporter substrate-binding protein [Chitinispirillaceae bacterium]